MVASTDNFKLLNKIYQKSVSPVKKKKKWKVSITMEYYIFELVKVPKFTLNKKFSIFGPTLPQKWFFGLKIILKQIILDFWCKYTSKGYCQSKTEKNENHQWKQHIRIRLNTIDFLDKISAKRAFPIENGHSKHHHWV